MAPGRRIYIGVRSIENTKICMETAGNNFEIYRDRPDLCIVYRGGADAGVQSEPEVVVVGTQSGVIQ